MEYFRNLFYRVITPSKTEITEITEIVNDEEKRKNLNLKNYKIDFEKFDKNIEAICIHNMFYKYK